jgi:AcrR family transcriptional regulator
LSLRQAKKAKTSQAILSAASARFAADGIEAARMDDIAAAAEVSVGTLYNYFGSKQSLLIALFEAEVREMLAAGSAAVSHDVDPVEAVRHLFAAYLDIMLATDRDLLREVLRFSLGGGAAIQELARLDEELMTQLAGLLAVHQESGRLDSSLPVEDAVFLLYAALIAELIIYLSLDGVAPKAVHANVGRRVRLVFNGLNP